MSNFEDDKTDNKDFTIPNPGKLRSWAESINENFEDLDEFLKFVHAASVGLEDDRVPDIWAQNASVENAPEDDTDVVRKVETDEIETGVDDLDESKIDSAEKGSEDGVAELDSDALVRQGQIPSLAITDVAVFDEESELEGWEEAEQGDVGIVRDDDDNGVSYILTTDDPTNLDNWQRLKAPRPPVDDVFGRTGSVNPQEEDYGEYYYGEGDDPEFGDATVESLILEDTSEEE